MNKKSLFISVLLILVLYQGFSLPPVRNITSADGSFYFDESFYYFIEDTIIIPVAESFQLAGRVTYIQSNNYIRTLLQPGCIFIFSPGIYMEITYGASITDSLTWVQEGYAEFTIERDKYVLSTRLKFLYDHSANQYFFLPDISGAYQFTEFYGLKIKYFFSGDSTSLFNHAFLTENRFTFNKSFGMDLLLTAGFELGGQNIPFQYEAGIRFRMVFTPDITLKVLTSYLGETETQGGLHTVLTLDIKFPRKRTSPEEKVLKTD